MECTVLFSALLGPSSSTQWTTGRARYAPDRHHCCCSLDTRLAVLASALAEIYSGNAGGGRTCGIRTYVLRRCLDRLFPSVRAAALAASAAFLA